MTPVYQTIIDSKVGNCMQASYASLLDLPLEEVPHFLEEPMGEDENCDIRLRKWLQSIGLTDMYINLDTPEVFRHVLWGLLWSGNNYCIATIESQKFKGGTHSVVAKINNGFPNILEIAHDPNPENKPYELPKVGLDDWSFLETYPIKAVSIILKYFPEADCK